MGTAADECTRLYGRAPSYILVDFATVGPAIATVDRLNGVTSPIGRARVSTANEPPTSSGYQTSVSRLSIISVLCLSLFNWFF
jgi:hypothetical protein